GPLLVQQSLLGGLIRRVLDLREEALIGIGGVVQIPPEMRMPHAVLWQRRGQSRIQTAEVVQVQCRQTGLQVSQRATWLVQPPGLPDEALQQHRRILLRTGTNRSAKSRA